MPFIVALLVAVVAYIAWELGNHVSVCPNCGREHLWRVPFQGDVICPERRHGR
jgi:hypothetical protein